MDERAKRMKMIKKDITDMYKILEGTYKIDHIIKMENKVKVQQKKINKQMLTLKDCKKAIRGQNRFFKDVERTNDQASHTEDIDHHFTEAKERFRQLKEEFRTQDKQLKDQH